MASTDKDLPFKLCVSALFRKMGYIAFNEVDLSTYTYQSSYRRKQITDFDVLGVRLEPDLAYSVAVAECKSVEERAMEHLLKLHGIQSFFGAEKAYFVQQRIDVNAREVGADMDIICLDAHNLSAMMASLDVREDREVSIERQVYGARAALLKQYKKDFPKQTEYLKYDFWTLPSHRNVINLIRLMSEMKEVQHDHSAHIVLSYQLVTAFSLAVLHLTGEVVRNNISEFQETLRTALLGGPRERRDREALHDFIAQVVPDASIPLEPDFFQPLAEIATRYVNAMQHSHRVVACLDEMSRRMLLPNTKHDESLTSLFSERTIKLSRDAFHFAITVAGLPKDLFTISLVD